MKNPNETLVGISDEQRLVLLDRGVYELNCKRRELLLARKRLAKQVALKNRLSKKLIQIAAEVRSVPVAELFNRRRFDWLACTRFMIWHLAESLLGMGVSDLGRLFGRNHSSIIQARESFSARYEYDAQFRKHADAIRQEFLAKTGLSQSWLDSKTPVVGLVSSNQK